MPVPVALIAERRVIMRLMSAGAVSAETAQPLDGLRWAQARRLRRLIDWGVVVESAANRYYLATPALAAHMTRRRHQMLVVVLVALLIVVLGTHYGRDFLR